MKTLVIKFCAAENILGGRCLFKCFIYVREIKSVSKVSVKRIIVFRNAVHVSVHWTAKSAFYVVFRRVSHLKYIMQCNKVGNGVLHNVVQNSQRRCMQFIKFVACSCHLRLMVYMKKSIYGIKWGGLYCGSVWLKVGTSYESVPISNYLSNIIYKILVSQC
jgi:hypothetical protein